MERIIQEVSTKKVRIVEGIAKKDFNVSINDVLKVMEINEAVRFMRDEWKDSTIVTTVSRANAIARMTKEIEDYQFKFNVCNESSNPYVQVTRNF